MHIFSCQIFDLTLTLMARTGITSQPQPGWWHWLLWELLQELSPRSHISLADRDHSNWQIQKNSLPIFIKLFLHSKILAKCPTADKFRHRSLPIRTWAQRRLKWRFSRDNVGSQNTLIFLYFDQRYSRGPKKERWLVGKGGRCMADFFRLISVWAVAVNPSAACWPAPVDSYPLWSKPVRAGFLPRTPNSF